MRDFLTIVEAAELARMSSRTIRRALAGRGRPLRHYRIGRRVVIAEGDLQRWIEGHAVVPILRPDSLRGVEGLFPDLGHLQVTQPRRAAEKANGHND